MITNKIQATFVLADAGYRRLKKPEVIAACKNCANLSFDHDDRMGSNGVLMRKINIHCSELEVRVALSRVCDRHAFRYSDKADA